MKSHSISTLPWAFRFALLLPLVSAQQLSYTTSTVTECFPSSTTSSPLAPPTPAPTQVTVTMPACPDCDCATCARTSVFVATFAVFCPSGTTRQTYTVTEVYRGMSSLPAFAGPPTAVPYGFTTGVETCTVCGEKPVVATMTYPSGGRPYASGMAVPTAPTGKPNAVTAAAPRAAWLSVSGFLMLGVGMVAAVF